MTLDDINPVKNHEGKELDDSNGTNGKGEQEKSTGSMEEANNKEDETNIAKDSEDESTLDDKDDDIMSVMSTTTTTTTSRSKSPTSRIDKMHRKVKPPKIVKPLFKYK